MTSKTHRIGIIGYGYIGSELHKLLNDTTVEVGSVFNRSEEKLNDIQDIATTDINEFVEGCAGLDLVVELAHPDISREWGEAILGKTNYMPCSVTALADDKVKDSLIEAAKTNNTQLLVPHGAVVGMDNIVEARDNWESLTITFRKPPASIGEGEEPDEDETIIFEGTVRQAAAKFPRNVNAMVACALASVGIDKAVARMIADKRATMLRGEFEFVGKDGSLLSISKAEPARGVSSPGMITSLKGSVLRALELENTELRFV